MRHTDKTRLSHSMTSLRPINLFKGRGRGGWPLRRRR
jgi:hypothetical protein